MAEKSSLQNLICEKKWEEAKDAIERQLVDLTEKRGEEECNSVLHTALAVNAPYVVINAIVTAAPEQVKETNKLNNLPIHFACVFKNEKWMSLAITDDRARIIELLMARHKEGLWKRSDEDKDYSYPIHCLMEYLPPAQLLKAMLDCYEQVEAPSPGKSIFTTKDCQQQTPLHVALQEHAPDDTILALLQNDKGKEALNVRGHLGYLPLHIAVFSGCTYKVFDELLRHESACGHITNKKNDCKMSPLALAFGADSEDRWTRDFTWSKSGLLSPDGVIIGTPRDLSSQRDLVMKMLNVLTKSLNGFQKSVDRGKTLKALAPTLGPLMKIVNNCKKNIGKDNISIDFQHVVAALESMRRVASD